MKMDKKKWFGVVIATVLVWVIFRITGCGGATSASSQKHDEQMKDLQQRIDALQKELAQPAKKPKAEPQSVAEAPQHYTVPSAFKSRVRLKAEAEIPSDELTSQQKVLRDHAEFTAQQAVEKDANADRVEAHLGKMDYTARCARESANRYAKAAKEARAKAERAGVKFDD